MALRVSRRRFTVEEFHRMADAQVFSEDDRVELLEGEIIEMAPIGSRHASCVDRLNQVFALALGEEVIVRVQNPLRLSQHSEPQPDLSVLRRRADFYAGAHPAAPMSSWSSRWRRHPPRLTERSRSRCTPAQAWSRSG